jgi:hypothetical protein
VYCSCCSTCMVTGASHNRVELCICMCACHGFESLADTALRRYCKLEVRSPAEGPELRHRTGRERTSSPTLQTLQDPILPLSWVCFRGGGFQTLADEGLQGEISAHMLAELQATCKHHVCLHIMSYEQRPGLQGGTTNELQTEREHRCQRALAQSTPLARRCDG